MLTKYVALVQSTVGVLNAEKLGHGIVETDSTKVRRGTLTEGCTVAVLLCDHADSKAPEFTITLSMTPEGLTYAAGKNLVVLVDKIKGKDVMLTDGERVNQSGVVGPNQELHVILAEGSPVLPNRELPYLAARCLPDSIG